MEYEDDTSEIDGARGEIEYWIRKEGYLWEIDENIRRKGGAVKIKWEST